jgi:NhaP-type Na+/H+ or K+/H+ antiporter
MRRPTVAFMGWFGPRGLASVVFGLLVLERGVPEEQTPLTTVVVTVALSVVLHGLTSAPSCAPIIAGTRITQRLTRRRQRRRRRRYHAGGTSSLAVTLCGSRGVKT